MTAMTPFDGREGLSLRQAAAIAGKGETTVRNWCDTYGIGRRIAGGPWCVSRVALSMLLEGDEKALEAYLGGDRRSELVAAHFRKCGVGHVLKDLQAGLDRSGKTDRAAS